MPVEWVRVRHEGVGGETDVPRESVANYEARGWQVVGDDTASDEAAAPETSAAPAVAAKRKES